jgi:hypothetical protein
MLAASLTFLLGTIGLGFATTAAIALLGAVVYGAGITLLDVLGRTLLQRSTEDDVLTRIFGAVEALWLLGYAAGAAIAPLLQRVAGLGTAFALMGVLVVVVTLVALPSLRRIDATAVVPQRQLDLLLGVPFFAPLPRPELERTANQLDRLPVSAGTEVIRQGDVGDRFYVVDAGSFRVEIDGEHIETIDEGGFFGEIALLHDVPRTATVRAVVDGAVWALDQEEFLATVTGLPQAQRAAHAVSAERLRAQEAS